MPYRDANPSPRQLLRLKRSFRSPFPTVHDAYFVYSIAALTCRCLEVAGRDPGVPTVPDYAAAARRPTTAACRERHRAGQLSASMLIWGHLRACQRRPNPRSSIIAFRRPTTPTSAATKRYARSRGPRVAMTVAHRRMIAGRWWCVPFGGTADLVRHASWAGGVPARRKGSTSARSCSSRARATTVA
jgi:hypothetical protein